MNLKQILITAIITGVIGVVTGMLLFHLQQREPRLSYEVKQGLPFMGDREKLSIQYVTLRNSGKKAVADVSCHISVDPALVKEIRVSADPALKYTEIADGSTISVHFMSLNPDEEASISFLASASSESVPMPQVSVRGSGVTGVAREEETKSTFFESPVFSTLTSAYAVLAAFLLLIRVRNRGRTTKILRAISRLEDDTTHTGDQNQILAYLFGLHGVVDEVDHYLSKPHRSSYWSESDRIAALALTGANDVDRECRRRVLQDLLAYAGVAPFSAAIIHYNIGRILRAQGLEDECSRHLEIAQEEFPKLIGSRLSLDPAFASQHPGAKTDDVLRGGTE